LDISIFLAKALGVYLLVVSSGMLVNSNSIKPILTDFLKNQGLLYVSGFVALIVGILIITSHNIWVADWRVLITIIGWMSFLKGTWLVVAPQAGHMLMAKWMKNHTAYVVAALVDLALGAYLYYAGCVHGQPEFLF
jgi:hypothetical protein